MKTFKELQKEQKQLNKELLKCPKCGVICEWKEMIEGTSCGACWCEMIPVPEVSPQDVFGKEKVG